LASTRQPLQTIAKISSSRPFERLLSGGILLQKASSIVCRFFTAVTQGKRSPQDFAIFKDITSPLLKPAGSARLMGEIHPRIL